ncbi:MAG: lipoate--protein ligase family protein [Haloferacaceae archaeon]
MTRADAEHGERTVERLLDRAVAAGDPATRVWRPAPCVAFGPRDRRAPGYDRARAAAERRGYAPVERSVGGRAVAYTGRTVAFAVARPTSGPRPDLTARYDDARERLLAALTGLGARVAAGEPARSFCPGDHGVRAVEGGKVAGLAQRVRADATGVAGCVLVDDRAAQREVLEPVSRALDLPFDPASVADLASAGADCGPDEVVRAVERALAPGE